MAHESPQNEHTVSNRAMELVVAGLFMLVSAVVMYDSHRIGSSWAFDGPEAGYFPFYVGALMFIASAVTFVKNLKPTVAGGETFVERGQLKLVLQVLIPTIVFVLAIGFLGIYLAGGLFIAFFMYFLGKYPIYKILPIAILIPLVLFVMFEVWFLVPLPKGPIETALGY